MQWLPHPAFCLSIGLQTDWQMKWPQSGLLVRTVRLVIPQLGGHLEQEQVAPRMTLIPFWIVLDRIGSRTIHSEARHAQKFFFCPLDQRRTVVEGEPEDPCDLPLPEREVAPTEHLPGSEKFPFAAG